MFLKSFFAAYEILGDPEKRKRYDQFGDEGDNNGGGNGNGFHGFNFNMDDFFKGFDSAFNAHKQGHHEHQQGFRFSFGGNGGGSFFNFDDLFGDEDEEYENGHDGFMEEGDSFFGFDPFGHDDHTMTFGFEDEEDDFFGHSGHNHYDRAHNHNHHAHHTHHRQMHDFHHNLHKQQRNVHNMRMNTARNMHTQSSSHSSGKLSLSSYFACLIHYKINNLFSSLFVLF